MQELHSKKKRVARGEHAVVVVWAEEEGSRSKEKVEGESEDQ